MPPTPTEFHSEEYKQIRAEVVGLVEKVDQYYKYIVLVPTGVYSWLIATAMGTNGTTPQSMSPTTCLKIPLALSILAWLIPPLFVVACGLILRAFGTRISQMGDYLTILENALGNSSLGWEKYNRPFAPNLTKARRQTLGIILAACVVVSFVGIFCSFMVGGYCSGK